MTKTLLTPFIILTMIFCAVLPCHLFADKFFEDNVAFFLKYLKQDKFDLDTSASAIVLYELLPLKWPSDEKLIYFSPYSLSYFDDNPFSNPVRKYPVELPYTYNVTYYYKMLLPQGYTVDEKLSPLNMVFDDNAKYQDEIVFDPSVNSLSVNYNMTISKTRYKVEQYPFLRDFFDKMISQQQKNIVIKKL